MNNNDTKKIIDYFINIFNSISIYDSFKSVDNILILSDNNNQNISKFLDTILNHKNNCIVTSDTFSSIRESKLKVYNNIIVMDSKTDEFIKSKNIDSNIYNINQLVEDYITEFEAKEYAYVLAIISLGLVIYYNERASEVINSIIDKINHLDIQNINNHDIIVCNELINTGLKVFDGNIKSMSFISFIDQNKDFNKVLFIGYFSDQDRKIIDNNFDNSDMELCDFNDEIEQVIYGIILSMYIGG